MKFPDLKRQKVPFKIMNKLTDEIDCVVGYSAGKRAMYSTKVFLQSGDFICLRYLLMRYSILPN